MASYGRAGQSEIQAKPRDDAYTVLLTISLLAMIAACMLLFYDLKRFPSIKPPTGFDRPPVTAQPPAPEVPPTPPPGEGTPMPPDGGMPPMANPATPPPAGMP